MGNGQLGHNCDKGNHAATHAVTDAVEVQPGVWQESPPRKGCAAHPVYAMVCFNDGRSMLATEYEAQYGNA